LSPSPHGMMMMYVRSKRGAVSQGVSHFMGSLSWFSKITAFAFGLLL